MKQQKFANLPLISKLHRLQAVTASLALAFTLLVSSVTQLWYQYDQMQDDARSTANIIGFNASAALLFGDSKSAVDILTALRAKPAIIAAQLYTTEGMPFASYSSNNQKISFPKSLAEANQQRKQNRKVLLTHVVVQPIAQQGDIEGYLYLLIDLRPMWHSVFSNFGQIFLVMLAAFLLSVFYGRRLAKFISAPLMRLALLAQQVSREKNYQVRATGEGEDEVGQLVKSFNQMIEQVQERDTELENHREQLENEVKVRTADLRNAVAAAQAASKAKSEFLATMSHEIRTPMNGVLGMTELLLSTELNLQQTRLAETAFRSAETLLAIINNILDFSKIEAGKFQLSYQNFDLRYLLEEITEMLAIQAHRKGVELTLTLPEQLNGMLHGDGERLRQVLVNLLSNAIKFTQHGEVKLIVSLLNNQDHQQELLFEVSDTGTGIAVEQQQFIFDSFTQIDSTTTRRFGGTGLGLAISKQLVEMMGGQLQLSSTMGKGSCFYFSLTLERSRQQSVADVMVKKSLKLTAKVLLAEDNLVNQEVGMGMLRAIGCQVELANNGLEAVAAVEHGNYDLVLMDCHMPEMDGFQSARAIRQVEQNAQKTSRIPIVALTADVQKGVVEQCLAAGMDDYLSKPFHKKQLQEMLEKWLPDAQIVTINTSVAAISAAPKPMSILNAEALENLRPLTTETGDSVLNKAIELFSGSAAQNISTLREALDNQDAQTLTKVAHSFKSSCTSLGAQALADYAAQVETLAKAGELQGIEALLASMTNDLPQILTALDAEIIRLPAHSAIPEVAVDAQKNRILLVDDELSFRLVSREALRAAGFVVDEAVNGRQALEKIKQQIPSLVLLDAVMDDDLDGFETCRLLRTEPGMMDVPIVMSTGLGDIDSINRAFDAGATDFIIKPLNYPIVIHRLNFILRAGHNTAELRNSKIQLTAAQRVARLGYWTWNTSNNQFEISAHLAKLCGIELEAFDGTLDGFLYLVHPEDREFVKKLFAEILQGQARPEADFRLTVAGAESVFVHQEIDHISDYGVPVIGTIQDVTARIEAEAELSIAAIAFESQEGMMITDADCIVLRGNQAFTKMTGYSTEEIVGRTPRLLKSGKHNKSFYAQMWRSIKQTGSWAGELWDQRKDGTIYPLWLSITAVKNRDGKVTHYVSSHTDISERKASEDQIKQLAFYDSLTGLANRRLLLERLKHSIEVERREGKQLALLMLDLDRFKSINDSWGHLAGDELLQQVAQRITSRLRDVDMVARLGGDEFVVLLENITRSEDAARIAQTIVNDLAKPFHLSQGTDVYIGTSIGIGLFPQHGDSPQTLMNNADAALYQAKSQGRGCYAYFSEELTRIVRERISLEARLRRAIEDQEFRVFFQAQVNIKTGQIVGAEALIRWQDPDKGLIPPIQFIQVAEETNLIIEMGEWILRETCLQGKAWLDAGFPPLTLAVNVSAKQFRHANLTALVTKVLKETGFPATHLELEITESGLMDYQDNQTQENTSGNQAGAVMVLNELRALGVRLAIDDFGTGYSSLAYLKSFPLNVLKIDKCFIDDIPDLKDDMEITATIIAMGRHLGFQVLAEGVETEAQLAFLQEKGCDIYQGYLKSRPLPAAAFAKLLQDEHVLFSAFAATPPDNSDLSA